MDQFPSHFKEHQQNSYRAFRPTQKAGLIPGWVLVLGLLVLAVLRLRRWRWRLLARWLGLPSPCHAVEVERNLPVVMPDGVTLMADHYFPQAEGAFPTILIRTPYGRGKEAGLAGWPMIFVGHLFAGQGYHVLIQGVRGRFDSEGTFDPLVHEAVDGQATLAWLAQQTWFNGQVGMWGPSYLGYVQWAVAADAPASLRVLAPGFITAYGYALPYPAQAFALDLVLRWIWALDLRTQPLGKMLLRLLLQERILQRSFQHVPLGDADICVVGRPVPFYREWLAHPTSEDPYWERADHRRHLAHVQVPAQLLTGWYDLFLADQLTDYAVLRQAGQRPHLIIGPWTHVDSQAGVASIREGAAWLAAHLQGKRHQLPQKPVRIFVMGADTWREMDDWPPPARETSYFLHAYGRLFPTPPATSSPPDHYRYDPADPTPTVGGPLLSQQAGPCDNRALESRPDVLCYTTPRLTADAEVIGRVRLVLYVRSNRAYTDFFGRLCDVYPDGRSINLCDGLFRVEPGKGDLLPDGSRRLLIDMGATAHRFRCGHRIRLQVSSGAHPRWNRNFGTGEPLESAVRMMTADQTIFHDQDHPSVLILPVPEPAPETEAIARNL